MRFASNRDIAISVTNLGLAESFYGGVMGFRLLERRGGTLVYDEDTSASTSPWGSPTPRGPLSP